MMYLVFPAAMILMVAIFKLFEWRTTRSNRASLNLDQIVTTSDTTIPAKRVIKHIKTVFVMAYEGDDADLETAFLMEVRKVGGNAVLNMKVSPKVIQGDAVIIE